MPLDAVPDHVAVAVPSIMRAAANWQVRLGGGWVGAGSRHPDAGFASRQLRYANGARLELLEPAGADGFLAAFLDRFGPRVHHVTLGVPDLLAAVETVRAGGYDVVDVSQEHDGWHEAFLRPSQVGGVVVQLAWSPHDLEASVRRSGGLVEEPAVDAPALLGPTLMHPDLAAADRLWTLLGAHVVADDGVMLARWPRGHLDVRVEAGDVPAPAGLRFGEGSRWWLEDPAADDGGGP